MPCIYQPSRSPWRYIITHLEMCFESTLTNEQCIALCMWMWDILTSLERSQNPDAADHVTYRATCSDYKETSGWQHDTCVLITEEWHTCAFLQHFMKLDSVWVIPVQSSHSMQVHPTIKKTFQSNCKESSISIGFYQFKTCSATNVVWFISKWLF